MNDRIKQLADDATHYANGVCDADPNADWYETRDQKFAELIVWECIAVCKSRVGITDYNTGRMHCASDIRDHFGVK
jgi:hypothetical protein